MMTGCYRNKWYIQDEPAKALFAVGIHGQWLYIEPATGVAIVRTASQALPVDEDLDRRISPYSTRSLTGQEPVKCHDDHDHRC